jgi:von Willebrand factor
MRFDIDSEILPLLTAMQCDPTCSNYSPCVSACPPDTCDNLMHPMRSQRLCASDGCVEGCKLNECPEGSVYDNSSYMSCVAKSLCKPVCLVDNDKTYYEGDVMTSDACHTCKCTRGSKTCSGEPCSVDVPDVSSVCFVSNILD